MQERKKLNPPAADRLVKYSPPPKSIWRFELSFAGTKGASGFSIQQFAFIPRYSQGGMIIELAGSGSTLIIASRKRPARQPLSDWFTCFYAVLLDFFSHSLLPKVYQFRG